MRVDRFGQQHHTGNQGGDTDRDVDQKHRAPPETAEQKPAHHRSEGRAHQGEGPPDADREIAFALDHEGDADQRQRGGAVAAQHVHHRLDRVGGARLPQVAEPGAQQHDLLRAQPRLQHQPVEAIVLGAAFQHLRHCLAHASNDPAQLDQKVTEASAAVARLIRS